MVRKKRRRASTTKRSLRADWSALQKQRRTERKESIRKDRVLNAARSLDACASYAIDQIHALRPVGSRPEPLVVELERTGQNLDFPTGNDEFCERFFTYRLVPAAQAVREAGLVKQVSQCDADDPLYRVTIRLFARVVRSRTPRGQRDKVVPELMRLRQKLGRDRYKIHGAFRLLAGKCPAWIRSNDQRAEQKGRDRRLTQRHIECVTALGEGSAVDEASVKSRPEIGRAALPKGSGSETLKNPLSELVQWGYLDSRQGRGGGYWLTPKGRGFYDSELSA